MLARKGVVLADPSVQAMNVMQWRLEAWAIAQKEKRERETLEQVFKLSLKAFRDTLVSVLGLNIGVPSKEEGAFYPMSLITGRPEIVKKMLDDHRIEDNIEELEEKQAAFSEAFLSGQFADALTAVEPETDPLKKWQSDETQDLLRSIGVLTSDEELAEMLEREDSFRKAASKGIMLGKP